MTYGTLSAVDTQTETAADFGRALQAARGEAKNPSYKAIERVAVSEMGPYAPVAETIRNYHNGAVSPERADLVLVCVLAKFYGKSVEDLSPTAARRLADARHLLAVASGSDPTPPKPRTLRRRLAAKGYDAADLMSALSADGPRYSTETIAEVMDAKEPPADSRLRAAYVDLHRRLDFTPDADDDATRTIGGYFNTSSVAA